ncbi:MAG: electron transport complex subunit RsxC [Nitrospirae bacterium]|nr:electron transport complex subunit RsxC [Nitrospirota bacterium]
MSVAQPNRITPTRRSFSGGIHPPSSKLLTRDQPIEVVPTPKQVRIPLLQHVGALCEAVVKSRDDVVAGDLVGTSEAPVSAFAHASISGKVTKESAATLPNGRRVPTVPIKAGGEQLEGQALLDDTYGGEWPTLRLDLPRPDLILQAVRDAGLVGMGGAAFPTHIKLALNPDRPIDTLVVNGCECEPYLTADYRLMVEAPRPIITGALLAASAVGARRILIGIEDDKRDAAEALSKAAESTDIEIRVVRTKYPQGSERQLVPVLIGSVVPADGLPLDVGVVVVNVATAAAIARAVLRGKPMTHRIVTVTGRGVAQPKNLLAPLGISYGELIETAGGLTPDAARVLAGGPMMGFTLGDLDTPVTKGTSGITVLTGEDLQQFEETSCVRCGLCVDACPLNLVPTRIALAARKGAWNLAERYYINACMECGCCAYQCPAQIPLVQLIRMGKAHLAAARV